MKKLLFTFTTATTFCALIMLTGVSAPKTLESKLNEQQNQIDQLMSLLQDVKKEDGKLIVPVMQTDKLVASTIEDSESNAVATSKLLQSSGFYIGESTNEGSKSATLTVQAGKGDLLFMLVPDKKSNRSFIGIGPGRLTGVELALERIGPSGRTHIARTNYQFNERFATELLSGVCVGFDDHERKEETRYELKVRNGRENANVNAIGLRLAALEVPSQQKKTD